MDLIDFIRSQGESALGMLDNSMHDLNEENVHWHPGGLSNSIAQLLAHVISGQDLLISGKLRGGTSLHESGWAEKTGIPLDRPQIWDRERWRLNLSAFEEYRQAVQANTRRYLEELTPAELEREVAWVRGPEQPIVRLLQTIFINHALGHCGEVSAIKGMCGLKGLPI